jgi:hypothetical protein
MKWIDCLTFSELNLFGRWLFFSFEFPTFIALFFALIVGGVSMCARPGDKRYWNRPFFEFDGFFFYAFYFPFAFGICVLCRTLWDVDGYFDEMIEILDFLLAVIIGIILIFLLVAGITWVSNARSNCGGYFTGVMLRWIKNTSLSSSSGIYAVFFIHKWFLAIIIACVPFDSLKWFVWHMGIGAMSCCACGIFTAWAIPFFTYMEMGVVCLYEFFLFVLI